MTTPFSTGVRSGPGPSDRMSSIGIVNRERSWGGSLGLGIAGVRIVISGLTPPLHQNLASRFRLFLDPTPEELEPPHADLRIRVRPAVVPGYLEFAKESGRAPQYRLETRAHEGRVHVWSYAFAGWFDLEGSEGEVNICESAVEPPERSIENFLRVAFAWKAARRGGFLLHASGLVRRGRAHLFFGPSGSGKTTVTRLSPSDLLLNDDCMSVFFEEGRFVARGVPFKGCEQGGARNTEAFPIAGFFRLVQSRRVQCERLGPARAVAEMASSVPFVSETPEGLEGCLSTIEQVVRAVPVHRLSFRLSPDFWTAVEETLRG